MGFRTFTRIALAFSFLFVGALFLNTGTANAVADLNISVNDGGTTLGGATVSLTFPDGTTETYTDDDNDGRIGIVLQNPGRYRMTITTADGRARTTTFNAPESGGVMVDYDVSAGSPRVTVNDNRDRGRRGSASPWSLDLLGVIGTTKWEGQSDNGSGTFNNGNKERLRKFGFGMGVRYALPNIPLFIASTFFYHAKARSKNSFSDGGSFNLEMRERWRMSFMLGYMIAQGDTMSLAILAGLSLARINMRILSGGSFQAEESKVQFVPTFGLESAWRLGNTSNLFFVMGITASIMNNITHTVSGGSNQFVRANGQVQIDSYAGIRVPF